MREEELTDIEMTAFADRLETFGRHLPPREEAFLRRMLLSLPQRDDVPAPPIRTVHDLVTAVDQSFLFPDDTFTPNPQPIPPSFRLSPYRENHRS